MVNITNFFLQVFKEGFFGFKKELEIFMVKNTFKEKGPLYFTAMTRHSIVIEQYMEPWLLESFFSKSNLPIKKYWCYDKSRKDDTGSLKAQYSI